MSIPLPSLDDRAYAELREEALALIPSLAPQWTNHNPSDPGITLIELFAWLTEMLIYRTGRLPEANLDAFLRLLNGPDWKREPGSDLQEAIRTTVLDLRSRHRAVTLEDYEALALDASPGVARVHCVPRRDLSGSTEARRLVSREGHVSLIVVPKRETGESGPPIPGPAILEAVRQKLAPRRLLTVRQIIAPPVYVPIQAEIVLAARPDVPAGPLRTRVEQAVRRYLDPLTGGPDGDGWPFGRDIYVSELYRLLEKEAQGVDYVPDISLSSLCPESTEEAVAGEELWNDEGDQIGIRLAAHHLPWVPESSLSILAVIGSVFLPVRIEIQATKAAGVDKAKALRRIKTVVRRLFHPLGGGPGGPAAWTIDTEQIQSLVMSLPDVAAVAAVRISPGPGRFEDNGMAGLGFGAGEIADLTLTVKI